MIYKSTRDSGVAVSASKAIAQGISKDGGLFVPQNIPQLNENDFEHLKKMTYIERAKYILGFYLDDFSEEELDYCVKGAYSEGFENNDPAPLKEIEKNKNILELWHGPTCAFKDLALQLLPYLLTTSAKKASRAKETIILVATSGDTGKAALEGFKDVKGTRIIVFYPNNGVSPMQKLQMNTQAGENVYVSAIEGNFDDAQSGVKAIFADEKVSKILEESDMAFSSANSINWGRLVPQIVYYVSAYCDLLNKGTDLAEGFNVVVPTGNFGNILAAYYAKTMGVPIAKLICASNANNVLTDFINTGVYSRNRNFYTTMSPSMDILISSNLERMLYELYDNNADKIAELQENLAKSGEFKVSNEVSEKIRNLFYGGCCDDAETLKTIKKYFETDNYLCDTHTAVAMAVYDEYLKKTLDKKPVVIASTASPYKFVSSVLRAIAPQEVGKKEFQMVSELWKASGVAVPNPIRALENALPRFSNICQKSKMTDAVLEALKLK
ncbi:MAG: threonine synthase [Oscillospiraceae bacterium]